jgi:hypothetical protein
MSEMEDSGEALMASWSQGGEHVLAMVIMLGTC